MARSVKPKKAERVETMKVGKTSIVIENIDIMDWSVGGSGHMHMTFADTNVEVHVGKKHVGGIRPGIGGGFHITVKGGEDGSTDRELCVHTRDIWNAGVKALGREDLIMPPKGG